MITINANPQVVTGKTSVLTATVSGTIPPVNPTYTWTVLDKPSNSTTTFSDNGTNTASTTTVTFNTAGGYLLQVTATDSSGFSDTGTIAIDVQQTFTLIGTSPGSVTLALPQKAQFLATTFDQFLHKMRVQPTSFTWSVQGPGTLTPTGFYTPPPTAGTATIVAAYGGKTRTSLATMSTGHFPTVATPASANPSTVTGHTSSLSVLGASSAGESNLQYNWSTTSMPAGAFPPVFTDNGTNMAKNTVVIFSQAGSYTLQVTIVDRDGMSVTSSVTVVVSQTLTFIDVQPTSVTLTAGP